MFILESKNDERIESISHDLGAAVALCNGFGRGLLKLLFAVIFCCATAFAQQKEAIRAPFFQGEALPKPPQQDAPWPHGDDALSKAAATLFEQGLADPRGLEYREIEIAVGSPWNGGGYPIKTQGWILPDDGRGGHFAVAWNGLVYPVVNVGAAANLRDGREAKNAGKERNSITFWPGVSEASAVHFAVPEPLKAVLLLRLGETALAQRHGSATKNEKDPYLALARDWAWNAFERAVTAHMRGDDRLALADARLLTRIQPAIEVEAKRRGFKPDSDFSNSRFPNRKLPYLPFLRQLPTLLADCERRVAKQKKPSPKKEGVAALIDDLENVDARQWGQPGGVSLAGDARVTAIVKRGNEAVEPLLETLENDGRLTRSVSFGRDFHRARHLIPVSEAAYAALVDLLRVGFKTYGENGESLPKKALAAQIRAYWAKMGDLSPVERFYKTLKDDKAGKDQWLQAAANIVQPTDVESHGGWTTVPNRKPGQKIELRGESLRDGRTPSLRQLLARRSDDIAAIRTGSTQDHFLYLDAGQMALNLADWDKTAAIPTLKKRLMRAWSIGAQPNDILASNGNPVQHFGTMIAKMTLARARCGDATAYDEYAAWIQKVELKGVSFGGEELQKPLIQGAARPSIGRAIDYLFNDPKSPWSNVFSRENGFWMMEFWRTSLPRTEGFKRQARRLLTDKEVIGAVELTPPQQRDSRGKGHINLPGVGMSYEGYDGLAPDDAAPQKKYSFRTCDITAYFYSRYQKGPKIQLYWPEIERDAAVLACLKWLEAKR